MCANYKERLASAERTIKRLEAESWEILPRLAALEEAANVQMTVKERLAGTVRKIASRIEQL